MAFFSKLFKKLPDTDCETCLQVRLVAERYILATETALSKALGLSVGQAVEEAKMPDDVDLCMSSPELKPGEVQAYREQLGYDQETFAKKFGISLSKVKEWEMVPS